MPLRVSGLLGLSVLLAAAEPFMEPSAVTTVLRFMEFGFLGAFCWYGLTKAIPRMQANSQREAERSRAHYSEVIDKLVERMEKDRAAERQTLHDMIQHCSQQGARR